MNTMITKKSLGLTNAQIAELIDNLSDDDFYEVMNLQGKDAEERKVMTVGQWIDMVMMEIEENIENSL